MISRKAGLGKEVFECYRASFIYLFFLKLKMGFIILSIWWKIFPQDFTLNILACKVHTVTQSICYNPKRCDLWEKHFL